MSPLKSFAKSGFSSKCCPIAELHVLVIVVLLDLQDRGGCSLWGRVLFLILDGTCCFILSFNVQFNQMFAFFKAISKFCTIK